MGEVIAIASQKGGVGKTTTAVNLSASLVYLGHRVLLIDVDSQGGIATTFGFGRYDIKAGILEVFTNGTPITAAIHSTGIENFDFIPINLWSDENDRRKLMGVAGKIKLKEAIAPIKDQYDFILIDCPLYPCSANIMR